MEQLEVVHALQVLVVLTTLSTLPVVCHSLSPVAASSGRPKKLFHFRKSQPVSATALTGRRKPQRPLMTLLSELSRALLDEWLSTGPLLKTSPTNWHRSSRLLAIFNRRTPTAVEIDYRIATFRSFFTNTSTHYRGFRFGDGRTFHDGSGRGWLFHAVFGVRVKKKTGDTNLWFA